MKLGKRVKLKDPFGPSIARWLWLAYGILVLVLVGTFIVYYWHNQRLDNHLDTLSTQENRQQIAQDMRFNAASIALSVSDYLRDNDDSALVNVGEFKSDFETNQEKLSEIAQTDEERYLSQEIDTLYEEYKSAVDETINASAGSLEESLAEFDLSYQALNTYLADQVLPSVDADVVEAQEEHDHLASLADMWFICLIIVGGLTCIIAAYFLSRKIAGPIRDLVNVAKRIESGRINHRFNVNAKGELGLVAISLNKMLHNLERIHKAMEQSEEQAWALLDVTSDTVILMDTRGNILASNELAAEKFDMSLEQIINESIYEHLPAASAVSLKLHIDEAIRLKRPVHYEDDQEGKIIDQNVLPMLNSKGEVNRIAIFSRDVTVHKWVEDVTVQYGRRYELILQAAGEGIFGLDTQGITTFVNPVAARMLGYEPEELIGKRHHELVHYSRPDGKPYPSDLCPIYASFKDGKVHSNVDSEVFWRKDGTSFPVNYTSTPIIEDDMILGAVITFRDTSKHK